MTNTATVSRSDALMSLLARRDFTEPDGPLRQIWRESDEPGTTVAALTPDDFGKRVIIRTGDFLGTVVGQLIGIAPHRSLRAFVTVQLFGKRELTVRGDLPTLVLN